MSKLTDIKQKISQMDGGEFQELCDAYLSKHGYRNIHSLGMKSGTHKTTKGIPDTYFTLVDGRYVLVMYTTQVTGDVLSKIEDDLKECFSGSKTGLSNSDIAEIIYCHTSSNIKAGDDKKLRALCKDKGVLLDIYGIDRISQDLYDKYHTLAHDFLSIPLDTGQIFSCDDFMQSYNSNALAATLDTEFQFRAKEIEEILDSLAKSNVVILCGQAGVGKTRIALESVRKIHAFSGGQLYCIRSNSLPIYEDLQIYLSPPGRYLLLIDDANQITGLEHILQYINRKGYDVKIIITVRDYAKSKVFNDVKGASNPHVVQIGRFSDKEIEDLMRNCFGILNHKCLEKIVNIAEGNARIAMIAGKIACDENRMDSINDATQLYEDYYGRYLNDNNVLREDKKLCATAGIIAFLDALHLGHLDALRPLFEYVQMSVDEFKVNTKRLHDLEIIDICNDKAVRFSEQCLSNYLLKHVFVDLKIIPLSLVISACYKIHKERVVNAVNILFNIFQSKDIQDNVLNSLRGIWSDLKNADDPHFFSFVRTFYKINPVETLVLLKEKIENEDAIDFDIDQIDFEKDKNHQAVENDILQILCGYANLTDLPVALDLLFDYFHKRLDLFMEFYHAISRRLSIDKDSEKYGYFTQIHLVKKIIDHANAWTDHAMCVLFLHIAKDLLHLVHRPSESGRKNTVVRYTIPVILSEGAQEYRGQIWTALSTLSQNSLYRKGVKSIIEDYGHVMRDEIDIQVIRFDIGFMVQLISRTFSPDNINDCITVNDFFKTLKRFEIDEGVDLSRFLNNRSFSIYTILKGERYLEEFDYRKEETLKKEAIAKYIEAANLSDIREIFEVCACVEPNRNRDEYGLRNGLAVVFTEIENNRDLYLDIVDCYLALDTPLSLNPQQIVEKLFDSLSEGDVYVLLNKYDYDMKNTWVYFYYYCLPESQITHQHVCRLYRFLSEKEGCINQSSCRLLDFLDKYIKTDEDVFTESCRIILGKMSYSPFMVSIYFRWLFNSEANLPEIVINRFNCQYSLLVDVYLATLSSDSHADYDGNFLYAIFSIYPSVLEIYIKYMISNEQQNKDYHKRRLMILWKSENYMDVFDQAAQIVIDNVEEMYWVHTSTHFESLLAHERSGEDIIPRQDEWLTHYIRNHAEDEKNMYSLFTAIAAFPPERRKKHILHFAKANENFDSFKKIPLEEPSWGGFGRLIPYMETRIEFLKSLLPDFVGIKYLNHKQKIIQDIDCWQQRIESEQINEMLRG